MTNLIAKLQKENEQLLDNEKQDLYKIQQLEKLNSEYGKQLDGQAEYIEQLKNKLKGFKEPNIKIQQLEKENELLKSNCDKCHEGHEQKILDLYNEKQDLKLQRDGQSITITELKIANREFTEDYNLQQKAINTLNDSGLKLMEENKELKVKISILEKAGDPTSQK